MQAQPVNIMSKLESMLPFLTGKEKRVGEFVLKHCQEVLSLALKEMAARTKVSEATIIRFCRKLGCKGYADFKLALSANLSLTHYNENSDLILEKILDGDPPGTVLKKISSFVITSIQTTVDIIDPVELDKAVRLIRETSQKNHRIYISAMGASSVLAKQMQGMFMRLMIPTIYYEDVHLQLESMLNISEDDLLICFTALGRSAQSHQYIDIANKQKAKVVLITQFGNQQLANKADATLFVSAVENNVRLISHIAVMVESLVAYTLFLSIALEDLPKIQNEVKEKNRVFMELGYTVSEHP